MKRFQLADPFYRVPVCRFSFGGGGTSDGRSSSYSKTIYPDQFLNQATNTIGRPFTVQELVAALPRSQGLFSGGTTSGAPTAAPAVRGSEGAPGGPQQVTATAPTTGGIDRPSEGGVPEYRIPGADNAPGLGAALGPGGIQGAFARLGFGQATPTHAAPTVGTVPTITAPTVNAAKASLAGGDYDKLQQSIFRSEYNPAARALSQQGELADAQARAQAAGAGIGASASGQAQVGQAKLERTRQLQQVAGDAADKAVQARYGLQFQETQANASRQQEANLAQANFNLDAQKSNAANVLQGKIADADSYLKTIGLDQQAAQQGRADLLTAIGLQEQDLARMDKTQLDSLTTLTNVYLQELGAFTVAGRETSAESFDRGTTQGRTGVLS